LLKVPEVTLRLKRESGENPELPRSGMWKRIRQQHWVLRSGKRR